MIGSHEWSHGNIEHDDNDLLDIGPFHNPLLDPTQENAAAEAFVRIYSAGGKTACNYKPEVGWGRWRKLIYNACLNPICAITSLDTGRIRLADDAIAGLVKPAMEEIRAAAKAMGHDLPEDIADSMINIDPLTMYLPPSMMGDMKKVSTPSLRQVFRRLLSINILTIPRATSPSLRISLANRCVKAPHSAFPCHAFVSCTSFVKQSNGERRSKGAWCQYHRKAHSRDPQECYSVLENEFISHDLTISASQRL